MPIINVMILDVLVLLNNTKPILTYTEENFNKYQKNIRQQKVEKYEAFMYVLPINESATHRTML